MDYFDTSRWPCNISSCIIILYYLTIDFIIFHYHSLFSAPWNDLALCICHSLLSFILYYFDTFQLPCRFLLFIIILYYAYLSDIRLLNYIIYHYHHHYNYHYYWDTLQWPCIATGSSGPSIHSTREKSYTWKSGIITSRKFWDQI